MTPLQIVDPSGSATVTYGGEVVTYGGNLVTFGDSYDVLAYQVQPRSVEYVRNITGMATGGSPKTRGDNKPNPAPLVVDITLWSIGLAEAAEYAFFLISKANESVEVIWHEGSLAVQGLLNYRLRHREDQVLLRLAFAPATTETL